MVLARLLGTRLDNTLTTYRLNLKLKYHTQAVFISKYLNFEPS